MKLFFVFIISIIFISCHTHPYTVEITYYNGQKDTIRFNGGGDLYLYQGDLRDMGGYTIASAVRRFKELN